MIHSRIANTSAGNGGRPSRTAEAPGLLVVMPVYNEQAAVKTVIRQWMGTLSGSTDSFLLLVINDGSTDSTLERIREMENECGGRIEILSRPNKGHGQTCIEGYRIALERGIPYVLQIDSDGQSDPAFFPAFWRIRHDYDVIYGQRRRSDGWRRIVASRVLKILLRLLQGVECPDANVPYRLMNAASCSAAILGIPRNIDLANVALAVSLQRDPAIRHGHIAISFPPRMGGEPSVPFAKFARKAFELFMQLGRPGRIHRAPEISAAKGEI